MTARGEEAIETLLAIRAGRRAPPPVYELLGISVIDAEAGYVQLGFTPDGRFGNPHGATAGGVLATVLDTALAWACDCAAPAGKICTTVEFKVNFLRAVRVDDARLRAEAKVIHGGSRILVADGRLLAPDGTLRASAISTCLVMDRPLQVPEM